MSETSTSSAITASLRRRDKREVQRGREMRLGGIEPPTCGLKDRCSLAPRRLPLTTELQARGDAVGHCSWIGGHQPPM